MIRRLICIVIAGLGFSAATHTWADDSESVTNRSTANDQQTNIDTAGFKAGCFYARDVSNFEPLNREYLIVYAPNKRRAYLLNFSPPSVDLRSAQAIAFDGTDRVCGKPGERMLVGRGMGRTYGVLDVWKIDATTVDRLIENKKARDNPVIEPAPESPGAAVETDVTLDD